MNARVEDLVRMAVEVTGFDDFGSDSYRPGLETLVSSLDEEAELHDFGRFTIDGLVVSNMLNRLRATAWISDHGAVLEQQVIAPVFILGLPRTGTTLLSYLLDQDSEFRSVMSWEVLESVPPPKRETFTVDERIAHVRDGKTMFDVLNPGFKAIHHEDPDGPTECLTILSQDFKSIFWETVANVPSYGSWLSTVDHTPAYEYHRTLLRLLQSEAPGRWILKSPAHRLHLDSLLAVYPDATFVVPHRDPVTVVASMCSLVSSLSGTFSAADHRLYIAEHWTELIGEMVRRVDEARDRDPALDARFLDFGYRELVERPLDVVRRIYDHVGAELSAGAESAMNAYLAGSPQGKYGSHTYESAELGLDIAEVDARFASYKSRYGIEAGERL